MAEWIKVVLHSTNAWFFFSFSFSFLLSLTKCINKKWHYVVGCNIKTHFCGLFTNVRQWCVLCCPCWILTQSEPRKNIRLLIFDICCFSEWQTVVNQVASKTLRPCFWAIKHQILRIHWGQLQNLPLQPFLNLAAMSHFCKSGKLLQHNTLVQICPLALRLRTLV